MTDRPLPSPNDRSRGEGTAAQAALARALRGARWSILWERLWPALVSLASAVGLFLVVSWLGVWLWLPPIGRAIALLVIFVVTAAASVPLLRLRMPSVQEGLRRLDRVSGLPHRPATTVNDELATAADDSLAVALWRTHVERTLERARNLRAGVPLPRLALRDPYALRALILVLLVATFFAAGGERLRRISAAFDWQGVVTPANFRIDAWVTPPLYTGRSPILLPGLRPGEPVQTAASFSVPAGSILVVRTTGRSGIDVTATGGVTEAPAGPRPPAGTDERRFSIDDGGAATVRGIAGENVTWTFNAIPDRPPTIALAKDPETQPQGALQLSYKMEDDYGVTEAKATFARKDVAGSQKERPLYTPPDFPLVLPQARTRNGTGQTVKDLTEHPLAGVNLVMTLIARDQAGNEGRSAAFELKLPERPFFKPLARALLEQRRMLALDAEVKPRILTALDALTLAPERFTPEASIYLGLRSIYWNLTAAKTDDDLRDVVARMWSMAVTIEDGNVGDAAAALRAAEEALRQALERNAGDDEIKRLTDQLRQAMNNFLQALAQEMRKNPQQLARPLDRNTRMIRPQDLKNMLDRLEELSRSGNKEAARRMLQELQAMMENLQMARPGGSPNGDDDADMQALDDLADMIHRQQQLRDRTFQQGQDMRRDRQRGQRGQGDQNQMGDLQKNQQALRDQLNKLLEQLRQRGYGQDPLGQQGQGQGKPDPLGQAGEAMGEAEGSLGKGNADSAVDSQGRALDAMRKGAQNLAQAMQQQRGVGQGPGRGPGRQAESDDGLDPLGRPMRRREYGDDASVKVPGEIDVQRARRILDELRKRFGESERPQLELDYIERLLKDF
ncbi:MAG: hypothetical protein QOF19_1029 [Alphaproteobacteria bacterium]|nr:hypothetical protein [Alphaproteobacteria bacterium]